MQISGIRGGFRALKESEKNKKNQTISKFEQMLQAEINRLAESQNDHLYYRCMECVHPKLRPKQICVKCGYCGREFDEDGHLENVDEYPSMY